MPAHTAYGYDLELSLGIGRQGEVGRWDDPAARWGLIVWDQPDTELGDWVDVTCSVPGEAVFAAGSDESRGVVVQWEAATCSFVLDGPDFDPWSGPYAGVLGPQTPVRWRWRVTGDTDWQPLFYGAVQDGGYQWDAMTETATVACSDPTSDLASFDAEAQTPDQGAGETAAARVSRILDMAQWPADARDITPGGVQLVATDLSGSALTQLQDVADTDLALMWVRRDGRFAYVPQGRANPQTPGGRLVACVAEPDDLAVIDMGRGDFTPVANIVAVRAGKAPSAEGDDPPYVVQENAASVARYRARQAKFDLLHDQTLRPDWSAVVGRLVLGAFSWPSMAPAEVLLGLASEDFRVPELLFTLEPSITFEVVDLAGRSWVMDVSGWEVAVSFNSCGGTLYLNDITATAGSQWDTAGWDADRWGLGKVS